MKKISFLAFIISLFLLQGCRTEDLLDKENSHGTFDYSDKISSRRIFPAEFQKIPELNVIFSRSETTLSQKIKTEKNILNGAIVDSAYALETTNGVVISYTFPVYRENQGRYFDNLVLQRKVGEPGFISYLYRYHAKEDMAYDQNNIEIYDLNMITPDAAGKILITSNTIQNGCSNITVNSVDCGEGGHHTNGAWCPTLHIFMPYNTVVTTDTCIGSGGPGGTTGGGNPPTGGGVPVGGDPVITSPVIKYPKYGYCRRGYHWDPLGLNSTQLSFVNSDEQNALRGEMGVFFTNNEVFSFDCNSPNTITPEVKSVGIWIVNYAMNNSEFLNSELRDKFLKSDFQFQQWAINYLIQHPDVSWTKFENWFLTKSEGQDGEYDEASELTFSQQQFQQHSLPSMAQYELAFPSKPNAQYPDYYRDAQPNHVVYNDYVGGKLKELFNQNGGDIRENPFRNACAVRQSYAHNKLGIMIPFQHVDLKGNNDWNYIMTASKMGIFLEKTYGQPTHKLMGADANDMAKITKFLEGKTGIYLVINNDPSKETGAGYTGHTDMIKNSYISGGANITDASGQIVRGGIKYIYIWELN